MIRLTANLEGSEQAIAAIGGVAERGRDLSRPLGLLTSHIVTMTVRDLRSGRFGVQARHESGNSLTKTMTSASGPNWGSVGSQAEHGLYQQFGAPGGRQVPTTSKYLTIPMGENVAAKGDPKYSHARDVPGGFVWKSPTSGELFIASAETRRPKVAGGRHKGRMAKLAERFEAAAGKLKLWFLLRRSVPGRPHNFCRFDEPRDRPRWDRYLADYLLGRR